jgi:hypothetical protein
MKTIHKFKLNIGNIPPAEVDNFMEKTISKLKRTPFIDPQTGEYNLRFNMQNLIEDYYIPVRGNDSATQIDTLTGLSYDGIQDVVFLRDELFAALKVPKAFMGYEKDLSGKSTLASQDIRFARTIDRIQRIILSELYKIALLHLYTQGYNNEDLTNFELSLTTPSIIYAQEKVALLKEQVDVAAAMMENDLFPSDFIYENVFDMSEDQYDEYRDLIIADKKRKFRLQQIEDEGNDPLESGKSYGTPHDLASLYGRGRYGDNSVPEGYDENVPLGRPKVKVSNRNTQDDAFGKDRLGVQGTKTKKNNVAVPTLESNVNLKNKMLLENIKQIYKFKKDKGSNLLDESQLGLEFSEEN